LLEAMGTYGTQAALLYEGGDCGEERSYDVGNVLTGYEVKRSSVEHGAGEVGCMRAPAWRWR
jgi:hypothetical protein